MYNLESRCRCRSLACDALHFQIENHYPFSHRIEARQFSIRIDRLRRTSGWESGLVRGRRRWRWERIDAAGLPFLATMFHAVGLNVMDARESKRDILEASRRALRDISKDVAGIKSRAENPRRYWADGLYIL
jgi:hypothetical protein